MSSLLKALNAVKIYNNRSFKTLTRTGDIKYIKINYKVDIMYGMAPRPRKVFSQVITVKTVDDLIHQVKEGTDEFRELQKYIIEEFKIK